MGMLALAVAFKNVSKSNSDEKTLPDSVDSSYAAVWQQIWICS